MLSRSHQQDPQECAEVWLTAFGAVSKRETMRHCRKKEWLAGWRFGVLGLILLLLTPVAEAQVVLIGSRYWTFLPGIDFSGNDIPDNTGQCGGRGYSNSNSSHCAAMCLSFSNCVGFEVMWDAGKCCWVKSWMSGAGSSNPDDAYILLQRTLYSIFVAKDVRLITVTAVSADPGANISAALPSGGTLTLTSGLTSDSFPATSGGIVAITVTASNGAATKIYYFRTAILQGNDASLQFLVLTPGLISPSFTPTTLNYSATFASGGETATLLALTNDAAALVSIGAGGKAAVGTISQTVPVPFGRSVLQITVTSESLSYTTVYYVIMQAPLAPPPPPLPPVPPSSFMTFPPPLPALSSPPRMVLAVGFVSGPAPSTRNPSAEFRFYARNGTGGDCSRCTFHCTLDGQTEPACTNPGPPTFNPVLNLRTYSVIVSAPREGPHTFSVDAFDPLGLSSAPGTYAWVTDLTPPVTLLTTNAPEDRPTSLQSVRINVTVRDRSPDGVTTTDCPSCNVQCSIDGGRFATCPQGQPLKFFLQPGRHVFAARSIDAAGNQEEAPVERVVVVDLTPPKAQLTLAPAPLTGTTSARFQFAATIAGSAVRCATCTFLCRLDQATWQSCLQGSEDASGAVYRNVSNGPHSFSVQITDPDGVLTSSLTYDWNAVLVGPTVGIFYYPPTSTALSNATFSFGAIVPGTNYSGSAGQPVPCPGCLFSCALDGGAPRLCDPGERLTYADLSEGTHTFSVYADDIFGNVGAPTGYTWQVNSSLPLGSVIFGPPLFAATNKTSAELTFTGTLRNLPCAGCTYQCQLNSGPFLGCNASTPLKLLALQQGTQSLVVRVTDVQGASTFSAPYEWVVDTIPPTVSILSGPSSVTGTSTAQFSFSANDTVNGVRTNCGQCTYDCAIDSVPFQPCDNPVIFLNLGLADSVTAHVLNVVSVDAAGNRALTPAVFRWTVDRRAPVVSVVGEPAGNDPSGTVAFSARANAASADCDNCTAFCSLDRSAPYPCGDVSDSSRAAAAFAHLKAGQHTATARFTNALGVAADSAFSWVAEFTGASVQISVPNSPVRRSPFPVVISFSKACLGGNGFTCVSVTSCELIVTGAAVPEPNSLSPLVPQQYSIQIIPISDGPIGISVPPGICLDEAGNPNFPAEASVVFQAKPPQAALVPVGLTPVSLTSTGGVSSTEWATNSSPILLTITFSREVIGFSLGGVQVTGGTAERLLAHRSTSAAASASPGGSNPSSDVSNPSSLVTISGAGDGTPGTAFSFRVVPFGRNGTVTVQILPGSCADSLGSPNRGSDAITLLFDTVRPTVSIAPRGSPGGIFGGLALNSAYLVEVRFSELVFVFANQTGTLTGSDYGTGQVSAIGLSVTGVAPQGDGLRYIVTLERDVRAAVTEGAVWVEEGAVRDAAGNLNQRSDVLKISFGGLPSAFTPRFAARGNLLGIVGTVQTFALFRKLAIRQSAVFREVTGSLATMNLESRPTSPSSAAATTPAVPSATLAGFRRLLSQNGTGAEAPVPTSLLNRQTESWHSSGPIFGRVLIVVSATSVVRTALSHVWTRVSDRTLPDLLLFPRAELQAGLFCFYPVSIACAALSQGPSLAHAFLGALLLLGIPCSAIVGIVGFLATHVILDSRASFEPFRDSPKAPTWRGRAVAACFGAPCAGRWTDTSRTPGRPVGRFGLLFESFRPPVDCRDDNLSGNETVIKPNKSNRRSRLADTSEGTGRDSGRLEASGSGHRGGTGRPGSSGMGGESSHHSGPFLLGAGMARRVADGARALVRMLRTCHVGAVLTKRLVFAALLAARERHVAGSEPGLGQVALLLTTSAVFLSWLVIAKPYVSRALQGVETGTGLLEVLTLSLALLSGRAEREAIRSGTAGTGILTEEEGGRSAAMLGLQIVAVGMQTGYQWWAAIVGLRAHWKVWREKRELDKGKSRQVWRSRENVRNGDQQWGLKKGHPRKPTDLRSVLRDKERRGVERRKGGESVREKACAEEAPTNSRVGAAPRVSHARRRNKRRLVTPPSTKNEVEVEKHWASDVDPALTPWLQEDLEKKPGIMSGAEPGKRDGKSPSIESVRGSADLGAFVAQIGASRKVEERRNAPHGARAARDERKGRDRNGRAERSVEREANERFDESNGGGGKAQRKQESHKLDCQPEPRQTLQSDRAQLSDPLKKVRQKAQSDARVVKKGTSLSPHSGGRLQVGGITEASIRASGLEQKSARAPRLGRLKSRGKVTATANMTYFVVSESDESEGSDAYCSQMGPSSARRGIVLSFIAAILAVCFVAPDSASADSTSCVDIPSGTGAQNPNRPCPSSKNPSVSDWDAEDRFENQYPTHRQLQQIAGTPLLTNLVNDTGSPVTATNPLLVNATSPEYNLTEIFLRLNITVLPKKFNLTRILPAILPTLNITALYQALNITINTTKLNITYPPPPPAYLCYGVEVEYLIVGNLTKTQFGSAPAFLYTAQVKIQASGTNFGKWAISEWGIRFAFANQDVLTGGNDLLPPAGVKLPAAANLLLLQPPPKLQTLKPAFLAGYDATQYTFKTTIQGTEIGANTTLRALPVGMDFISPGVICDPINLRLVNGTNSTDATASDPTAETPPAPANPGVQITWDVLNSIKESYTAFIRIQNQQPYRPISGDGWTLGFALQMQEVIWSISGGFVIYRGDCLSYAGKTYGPVTGAQACTATPKIRDTSSQNGTLPTYKINSTLAQANLTLSLGRSIDFFDAKYLSPPQNWSIGVPGYLCGEPVETQPSLFPLNNYSYTTYPAAVTYTIQCVLTPDALATTSCSVSMSSYWNKTITTPNACACACSEYQYAQGCDQTLPALPGAAAAIDLGPTTDKKPVQFPGQIPCSDGCTTSIHLDLYQTFKGGWVMKVMLANPGPQTVRDWLLVLQFPYLSNLENVFSVNNLADTDNELLLFGYSYYNNYLLGNGGNIGAELQFNDSGIPGGTAKHVPIGVFPTQVLFMGEKCAMPAQLPWSSDGDRFRVSTVLLVAFLFALPLVI
ncbi:hypothetical protein KFL_004470040 [Klebsormidium nitens]|uniref:Uncharacterized protein n=1 Tax=Klebsormidium nitens TaxID=105231 RepID=A0A1Y1IGL9_KLENI|nr:hypothetical protein KFL_004470040 [Klebsormidium nitens]|eukprot:GAQ88639.1 hypothetical protein KFL_004470040 [Klebsormidium nitens]